MDLVGGHGVQAAAEGIVNKEAVPAAIAKKMNIAKK